MLEKFVTGSQGTNIFSASTYTGIEIISDLHPLTNLEIEHSAQLGLCDRACLSKAILRTRYISDETFSAGTRWKGSQTRQHETGDHEKNRKKTFLSGNELESKLYVVLNQYMSKVAFRARG